MSKFKEFSGNNLHVTVMQKFVFESVKNTVGKG